MYELKEKNYIPVFAHVERYIEVQENPDLIYDVINAGAIIQINSHSILGKSGKELQRTCDTLINRNMVVRNIQKKLRITYLLKIIMR